MFVKSLKVLAVAAVLAGGASLATAGSANAGTSFGIYVGGGHGGIYLAHPHPRRFHRGFCGPRRALNKAWRMGVNRPHVAKIRPNRIVVKGWNYGHRAKVVFKRNHHRCPVIKTRGLY